MMTVRFATGVAVQYNGAYMFYRSDDGTRQLYTTRKEDGGTWIADVPRDAIVEGATQPCRVYNGVTAAELATDFLLALNDTRQSNGMSVGRLAEIKAVLDRFDARRKVWK